MATIKDIAKHTGVSVTTVSRVLNNRGYISEATREKVYGAMKKINYHPNEVARSLLRKRTNMIGVVMPTVISPYFGAVLQAIELSCYETGLKVIICTSNHEKEKEAQFADMLKANKVDGIILCSRTQDMSHFKDLGLPIVGIERANDEIPMVSCDNMEGGRLATRHLIECGCKKLGLLAGNTELNIIGNLRIDAFTEECINAGIKYVIAENHENGYIDIKKFLCENPDLDGIFASGDVVAAKALQKCAKLGKTVPKDIKIVGFDGTIISESTVPMITSIVQPITLLGKHAVKILVDQIEGVVVPNQTIFPVKLDVRGSTVSGLA